MSYSNLIHADAGPFVDPLKADIDCPGCEFIGDSAVATAAFASSCEMERWLEHPDLCDDCREDIEDDLKS